MPRKPLAAALTACLLAAPTAASAQQATDVPVCSRNLGTIAVIEPTGQNWWTGQRLPSPAALIKVYVNRSRCFTLVDRGTGMQAMQAERALASSGELRGGSNIGKGQIRAADYVLVPDVVSQNRNAGGTNIGGVVGGLLGNRRAAAVVGGVNLKRSSADVVLTVTDARSSEQVAMSEGHATRTDVGWRGGGGGFGGALVAGGASGYANTEIGQVVAQAYIQAYSDLVAQLGGLPSDASAANVAQAVTLSRPGRLLKSPDGSGGAVRDLEPGMLLYPTGTKEGTMWEVEDEVGNRGWVNSTQVSNAR
ncbi:CsgG/HfaB family protein [Luteimonas arsenica]|uniref:CsgG/HfaB family protein n=1 Tax=Luteimonas arsenica TaxID=1586242 RepID=UPI001055285C|nr:CsgG/HfaB family protein [Luteimonas arsenica]